MKDYGTDEKSKWLYVGYMCVCVEKGKNGD